MKKLVCEMCGGSAFVKEGGLFVCKTCGMSYSPEDAKSIMVEIPDGETASPAAPADAGVSTVRVDRTEELKNRMKNVKVEYDNSNLDDVKRLCQDILNIDPDYYEAIVYKALAAGWQSSIADPKIVTASKELRRANGILRTQQPDNVNFTQSCLFPLKELGRIAAAFFATHEKHYNKRKSDSNSYAAKYKKGQSELWGYVGSSVYYSANDRINGYLDTANKIEREAVDTYNGGCETVCIAVMNYIIEICNSLGKDHHYCDGFLNEMQNCLDVCDGYLTTDGVLEQYRSVLMHIFGLKIEAQNTYWADHPEEKAAHDRKLQKEKEKKERKELEEKKKAYANVIIGCENAADIQTLERMTDRLKEYVDFEDGKTKYDLYSEKLSAMKSAEAERIERERKEREAAKAARKQAMIKRLKVFGPPAAAILVLIVGFIVLNQKVLQPNKAYKEAVALMENERYNEAIAAFEKLGDYKNSKENIENCKSNIFNTAYTTAISLMEEKNYGAAGIQFCKIGAYKDAAELAETCWTKLGLRHTIFAGVFHTVGIKKDGTVIAVGNNNSGECNVSGWNNIISISAGYGYTVGLKKDGTVVATGINDYGQCDVSDWHDIVAICAGGHHTVGLKKDGTVVAIGINNDGQCNVYYWKNIVCISAGDRFTIGVNTDGTLLVAGEQSRIRSRWEDIRSVSSWGTHIIGIKNNSMVVTNEKNTSIDEWTGITSVAIGANHYVGLTEHATVVAAGRNDVNQCNVSSWTDIAAIAAGYNYTVGLKKDGTVVATGDNAKGQCNVSGWKDIKVPE